MKSKANKGRKRLHLLNKMHKYVIRYEAIKIEAEKRTIVGETLVNLCHDGRRPTEDVVEVNVYN